jgi:site-specific DNA recombinase
VKALQVGLLKGLKWNAELVEGVSPSIRAIAERDGVCEDYVQRLRKLAFLAPDIIEAVIEGNVPDTITLDTLHRRFPLDWVEQRRKFLGATSS